MNPASYKSPVKKKQGKKSERRGEEKTRKEIVKTAVSRLNFAL